MIHKYRIATWYHQSCYVFPALDKKKNIEFYRLRWDDFPAVGGPKTLTIFVILFISTLWYYPGWNQYDNAN